MKQLLFSIFIFCTLSSHAQDPEFSQARSGLLIINPAFAGSWACGRAETSYRLQWPQISGCYQTSNTSYDQYFKFGGVGFNYMHDDQGRGILKTDRFDFDYAPYISLYKDSTGKGKIIIQVGIDVCYYQRKMDFSKLNFGDMIDPRRGFVYTTNEVGNSTISNLDISSGLLVYSKRLAVGIAAYHLTKPNESFLGGNSPLPMRFVFHASGVIGNLDETQHHLRIIPSVIVMKQQDFEMLALNLSATYRAFNLGIGYRNQDALIFSAGYAHGYTYVGYSYDLTTSKLTSATGGAHEIHLGCRFGNKKWSGSRTNLQLFN